MNWKLLLLAAALCGLLAVGFLVRVERDEPLELTVLHTNDVHAHYDPFEPWGEPVQGGVARLKTLIESIRHDADNVLLLDAGDQFQGTLYFTVGGAEVVADVMHELGYDGMCVGNHEFDAGPGELARFIDLAHFPVLSANIDAKNDADLSTSLFPYAAYHIDRDIVGVFGLTAEHTAIASSPGPNVRFLDAIVSAQSTVDELRENGVDKIIALTHLGHERDLELAAAVDGIDIIVGGHSHTLLDDYPTVVSSASGEPVLVVTAHEWGKRLGRLDVTFTDDGLVGSFAGELIVIDETIPQDEGMLDVLATYRPQIDALMTRVVGTADVDLNASRDDVRVRETNLADLICDAMLWKAAGLGATVAIQNGGGVRASIPAGEITMGQILEVLPYGNQLTVVSLTGAQLVAALENGVSQVEDQAGRFPHVAGLRYTFDPAAEPGARIVRVEIEDAATGAFTPVDPTAITVVATNNFLADGGDDYAVFADATQRYDSGWLLSDALAEYLAEAGPVSPEVEGRITEDSPEAPAPEPSEADASDADAASEGP